MGLSATKTPSWPSTTSSFLAKLCERRRPPGLAHGAGRLRLAPQPALGPIARPGSAATTGLLDEAEVATDVMCKSCSEVLPVWPELVGNAASNVSADAVVGPLNPSCTRAWSPPRSTPRAGTEGWRVHHGGGQLGPGLRQDLGARSGPTSTIRASSGSFTSSTTSEARERRWCP